MFKVKTIKDSIKYILFSILTTSISYIMVSFVKWDIEWIKYIPEYKNSSRMILLFSYIAKEFISYGFYAAIKYKLL